MCTDDNNAILKINQLIKLIKLKIIKDKINVTN